MLKKLRLKFVGSAMGAIALVLLAIVGGINLRNYIQITENADRTLQIIADNGGRFPYRFPISERPLEEEAKIQKSDKASGSSGESGEGAENAVDKDDRKGHLMPSGMSPETPYETRFFTVVLSEKGEILSTDLTESPQWMLKPPKATPRSFLKAEKREASKEITGTGRCFSRKDGCVFSWIAPRA